MLRSTLVALVTLAALTSTTHAFELGLGLRVGTQGLGVEGAFGATEWLTVRAGLYGGSVSHDFEEGGIDYDGDLKVGGAGALADFFPLRGRFRLTAGLFSNANEIEIEARPTGPVTIGGTVYTPLQVGTLLGEVDFDATAPYFGVGWGNVAQGRRLGFVFDLGVLRQGSGDVSLRATNGGVGDADLEQEAREIEDDIDGYDLWPVISAGVAIRF